MSHPHEKAQLDVLKVHGLSVDEIMNRRTMFTSRYAEASKEAK